MATHEYRFTGRAFSVVQPWASAIAFAGKDIENRSWQTHYRGPLAIHASAKLDRDLLSRMQRVVRGGEKRPLIDWINKGRRQYGLEPEELPGRSQIVAVAMLVNCVDKSSSPWFGGDNWGWVIAGIVPISPVPRKGGLGLWECSFKYRPLVRMH